MHVPRLFIFFTVMLMTLQGEGLVYRASFAGEELAPIEDISLSADNESLYLAYTPPDSAATVVATLSPELEEINTVRMDGLISPCIKAYNDHVYLACIQGEEIVLRVLSRNLVVMKDFRISVEEPTDVYILPYKEGILLAYVHRFLEEDLLHQDVFLKKLDFSFNEIAETRLTYWDYWEDPCMAMYENSIFVSSANAPLYGFLDRHLIIVQLNENLEALGQIRYPKDASEWRNITQPDMIAVEDGVVLFFRMTDRNYSYKMFTWQGSVTVVPGNIRTIEIAEDLTIQAEAAVSEDYIEEYTPTAVSAFGRVYLGYCATEKEGVSLQILCADTVEGLKIQPPPQKSYWIYMPFVMIILAAAVILIVMRRLKPKKKKKK